MVEVKNEFGYEYMNMNTHPEKQHYISFLTLLSVMSFALQLCGCGLLGVGIWLSVSQGSFATFSPSFPSLSAANMVIAIGAIVMVTGFLGCLGAIKENKCLLLSVS